MHRTERSAARINPKLGLAPITGLHSADGELEDLKLEDLALAYGPHMPAAHVLFSVSDELSIAQRRALKSEH